MALLHQPESRQLSLKKLSELETLGPIDRTPGIPGSDKNAVSDGYSAVVLSVDGWLDGKLREG